MSEGWAVKRQCSQYNMCELGKFNIEKCQNVIVFLYFCKVLSFKVPWCIFVDYTKRKKTDENLSATEKEKYQK